MIAHATGSQINAALQTSGVQIEVGPFLIHVRSDLSSLHRHIATLYSDFPIRALQACHFDIAVVGTPGLRRWLRPQANLSINGARPYFPLPAHLAGASMEWGINWCIGQRAQRWLVLHAAVIERGGRALVLPAPSGSGKSTLCADLAYSGWRLFSDEFAIVDPASGELVPAPRPLSLKEAAIEIIRRRHPDVVYGPEGHDVEDTRFVHAQPMADAVRRAGERAQPGLIVFPRYVAGAITSLEPVQRSRALVEIADQSFNYNHLGSAGFSALVGLVRASRCFLLEYSDLDDVRARLEQLLAL